MSHPPVDSPDYYERHWQANRLKMSASLEEKIRLMEELIPSDVGTILDVGCGNGLITNALGKRFAVTGVDRSPAALTHLDGPSICASADQIPVPDQSFDMVLSSELLEHLPDAVLAGATREMSRIARRHLLLAVPNREYLRKRYSRCPACGLEFHAYLHQHSFTPERLDALFPEFQRLQTLTCGVREVPTHPALDTMRQRWGRHWFVPDDLHCPRCDHAITAVRRSLPRQAIGRMADALNLLFRLTVPSEPFWLLAAYERRTP
jgi:SAM-dependent methyltransferase